MSGRGEALEGAGAPLACGAGPPPSPVPDDHAVQARFAHTQ